MPTAFPPAVNVSPLIRFARYSMLLMGIGYGAFWQSRYTKKELALKDIKAKEKAARDAQLAKEKAYNAKISDDFFIADNSNESVADHSNESMVAGHSNESESFEIVSGYDTSDIEVPESPVAERPMQCPPRQSDDAYLGIQGAEPEEEKN